MSPNEIESEISVNPKLMILGLGVDSGPSMPRGHFDILRSAEVVCFRTLIHPGARELSDELTNSGVRVVSFDLEYESNADFESVYKTIVASVKEELSRAGAAQGRHVCYLVPGSPLVAEETVRLLRLDPEVDAVVFPSVSFLELTFLRTGIDPVGGFAIVDASDLLERPYLVGSSPTLVGQVWSEEGLYEVIAQIDEVDETCGITYLWHLGLPEEQVMDVRDPNFRTAHRPTDHLTTLLVTDLKSEAEAVGRLWQVIKELRLKCPWDREQTHESLGRHLLEESYEALEALDELSASSELTDQAMAHLEEELGDLLIQVMFHSNLAREEGFFSLSSLADLVRDKLVYRHPHVFGDVEVTRAEEVVTNWERLKLIEKGRSSVLEGIPSALPALAQAQKVIRKAPSVGLANPPVGDRVSALIELSSTLLFESALSQEVLGEILFLSASLCSSANLDAEGALRLQTAALMDRIRRAESEGA